MKKSIIGDVSDLLTENQKESGCLVEAKEFFQKLNKKDVVCIDHENVYFVSSHPHEHHCILAFDKVNNVIEFQHEELAKHQNLCNFS